MMIMKMCRDIVRRIGGITIKGKNDQPEPIPSVPREPDGSSDGSSVSEPDRTPLRGPGVGV